MNFANLTKAAMAAKDMAASAASKAKDLAHDASDAAVRARQQALEAAGVADKTEDDDTLPELKCERPARRDHAPRALLFAAEPVLRMPFYYSQAPLSSLSRALAGRTSASTATCANCTSTRTATSAR